MKLAAVPGALLLAMTLALQAPDVRGQERKPLVAVLDLVPDRSVGLVAPTLEEARALTEQLRIELVQTGKFAVVEPARIAEALEANGLAEAGCYRQACALAIGRLVGADKVITGRVVRAMTLLWGVDIETLDVGSGRRHGEVGELPGGGSSGGSSMVRSGNPVRRVAEFKGDYLMLKARGMRQLARQVAGE